MKTRIVKWLGILLIGFTGCYDYSNLENIAVDPFSPDFVFPLMKSKVSFRELAERSGANTIVEQHAGSNMYFLAFRDTIDIGLASLQFSIPSFPFSNSFQVPAGQIPPIFPAGLTIGPLTETFDQTYNSLAGAELKRIDLSGGTLQISLTNNFYHSINGTITITSLKDASNNPTRLNFSLPTNGSVYNNSINLNGYYLDLLDAPSTYNNFKYSISASITSSGNPDVSGNIAIDFLLDSPGYQTITGKFDQSFVHANQPYTIGVFASTILAEQHLAQPKLTLNFINSFGVPASVNFTRFEVENNLGNIITLRNEGTPQPGDMLIGTPNNLDYATSSKPTGSTKLKLDYANSNIEDVFDVAPRTLSFGATFKIGDGSDNHDYFIRSNSKFQLLSEIEIPVYGWVVTNEIADTILNVDWPDLEKDLNMANDASGKIRLKFKFTNELPLNMFFQVKFLDDNGAVVTQLFDNGSEWFFKSSPVNATTGESAGSTIAYSYITIDRAKYNKMSLSKNMVLYYKFTTGGSLHQNVTILSSNSIGVDMSLEVSGTVQL